MLVWTGTTGSVIGYEQIRALFRNVSTGATTVKEGPRIVVCLDCLVMIFLFRLILFKLARASTGCVTQLMNIVHFLRLYL